MKRYDVLDYGVKVNDEKQQTKEIQNVINMCKEEGGIVVFPTGTYNISSLRLYSNTTILLEKDTKIIASSEICDYIDFKLDTTLGYAKNEYYIKKWDIPKYYTMGVFAAANECNIKIIGCEGSQIDGSDCYDQNGEEGFRGPMGIVFSRCNNIELEGYEYTNSANWSHQLDSSTNIKINNVRINAGHDGFNLHHCTNVEISNCDLKTGDDCIAGYDIENLTVKGCKLNTSCNTFRVGGSNIVVEDCTVYGPGIYPHLSKNTFYTHSLFKYYAMKEEKCRSNGEIKFINCHISELDRLLSYQYGSKDNMQDGKPLAVISFIDCSINNLRNTTYIKGNGKDVEIIFNRSNIEFRSAYKELLFNVDKNVTIKYNESKIVER